MKFDPLATSPHARADGSGRLAVHGSQGPGRATRPTRRWRRPGVAEDSGGVDGPQESTVAPRTTDRFGATYPPRHIDIKHEHPTGAAPGEIVTVDGDTAVRLR